MDFQSSRLGQILVAQAAIAVNLALTSWNEEISYSFKKNSLEVPKLYFIKRYGKNCFSLS